MAHMLRSVLDELNIDVSLILTPESGLYTCCRLDSGHSQVRHGPGPHTQNFCSYISDSANISKATTYRLHAEIMTENNAEYMAANEDGP